MGYRLTGIVSLADADAAANQVLSGGSAASLQAGENGRSGPSHRVGVDQPPLLDEADDPGHPVGLTPDSEVSEARMRIKSLRGSGQPVVVRPRIAYDRLHAPDPMRWRAFTPPVEAQPASDGKDCI